MRYLLVFILLLLYISYINCIKFNSNEHERIGDAAFNNILDKLPLEYRNKVKNGFQINDSQHIKWGQLTELFGDYYAPDAGAICEAKTDDEKESRFLNAYHELIDKSKSNVRHISNALRFGKFLGKQEDLAKKEGIKSWQTKDLSSKSKFKSISEIFKNKHEAPILYHNGVEYVPFLISLGVTGLKLLKNTATSYDHHGNDAIIAYKTSMKIALRHAIKAHKLHKQKDNKWMNELSTAFQISGCGCHFLTDRFAAGHMEKFVRKFVDENCFLMKMVLKKHHDEQNQLGLNVVNKAGERWKTFGDGGANTGSPTFKHAVEALEANLKDLINTFETGKEPETYSALKYVPERDTKANNYPPLFRHHNNDWQYRVSAPTTTSKPVYRKVSCLRSALEIIKAHKHTCYSSADGTTIYVNSVGKCKKNTTGLKRLFKCSGNDQCSSDESEKCQGKCICGRKSGCLCLQPLESKSIVKCHSVVKL